MTEGSFAPLSLSLLKIGQRIRIVLFNATTAARQRFRTLLYESTTVFIPNVWGKIKMRAKKDGARSGGVAEKAKN